MKIGSTLAIIVFVIVAIGHLLRVVYGISMTIGTWNVPLWVSILGVIGPGAIALLLWKENR